MKRQIFVLVERWVLVGYGERHGDSWVITDAWQVTRWRGGQGIGAVARLGPTAGQATLHEEGTVYVHQSAIVRRIGCDEKAWSSHGR
jgi:hypothetical protein